MRQAGRQERKKTELVSRVFLFALSLFILCVSLAAASPKPVEKVEVEGLASIDREELLGLLDIRTGETIDRVRVGEGIKRAFFKGIFDDIEVYSNTEGTEVKVFIVERDRIRKISLSGGDAFSRREMRKMFSLREGLIMRDGLIDEAVKGLKESIAERGFPGVVVAASILPTEMPYSKDVVITVNEGQPLLIKRIVIHGVQDEELRRVTRVTEGSVYDLKEVGKDVERIRNHYKELGYLNPRVSFRFSDGNLGIEVSKGKSLQVFFEGNSEFSSTRLMKEMPFFETGELRDDLIEDATLKITALYYTKGYALAQVAPVMSEAGDSMSLRFFIFEGEQVKVGSLNFPGMSLNEKNLKDILPLKENDYYNPSLLSSNIDVMREFHIALGYLGVEVEVPSVSIEQNKAAITIPIKEGQKTVIGKVEITGAVSIPSDEIEKAIRLKEDVPYNEVDIADARARVMDIYFERGFMDVVVNAKVDFSGEKALIAFTIHEGEKTFFGKTIVTGNVSTRTTVIQRELLHRESAPFNPAILAKERQKLNKLGLFTDVRVEALEPYDHKRDIRIDVAEGNAGSVEFGFGYSNYDKLSAFVDVGYKNLFGLNRQVSLRVGYNSLEKLYAINYFDPWFLNRPLPFKGTVYRTEKEEKNIDTKVVMYRYRKHGLSMGFERQITDAIKGEIYYDYVLTNTFNVQPDIILTEQDTGKLSISSVRPGVTYDTRDNPFQPRKGVLAGLTVKVASAALLSQADFVKAVFNGSVYQEISRPFVVAAAFRLGLAQGWGDSTVLPLVERFFLGGRGTVRGYAQDTLGPKGVNGNPTGGNAFIETNLELRTFLGKGIGIVTFLDSGNVWQRIGDIDWSLKHAVGMGLRYDTPVGPFRLDYGYKLKKEAGLSRGELFFSIGQAF